MAQPYPPQGQQTPHTERPLKVYAEQYHTGMDPLPVGVQTDPNVFQDGQPFVVAGPIVYAVQDTDWVISNRYSGQPIAVVSAEEFSERFGGAP